MRSRLLERNAVDLRIRVARFEARDLIAKCRSALVVLRFHCLLEFQVQRPQLSLESEGAGSFRGNLSFVDDTFMHVLKDAAEPITKRDVALRATESSGFLEIGLGEAALRASKIIRGRGFHLLGSSQAEEHIGQGEPGGIGHIPLFGAFFTEIDLLHLAIEDLREVNGGIFGLADLADHKGAF